MGSCSISLPDAIVALPKLMDAKEILFIMDCAVEFSPNITKFGRAWYNLKDPDIVLEYDNGVDFMKYVNNYFERPPTALVGQHLEPSVSQRMGRECTSSSDGKEVIC